jgi:UDP-N-acetylglucosamine transferase subunit ALG13
MTSRTPRRTRDVGPASSAAGGRTVVPPATCLVTVGTTCFVSLMATLESEADDFVLAVARHCITRLVLQVGSFASSLAAFPNLSAACDRMGLQLEVFGLTDAATFQTFIASASLVVSHGGMFCGYRGSQK